MILMTEMIGDAVERRFGLLGVDPFLREAFELHRTDAGELILTDLFEMMEFYG